MMLTFRHTTRGTFV